MWTKTLTGEYRGAKVFNISVEDLLKRIPSLEFANFEGGEFERETIMTDSIFYRKGTWIDGTFPEVIHESKVLNGEFTETSKVQYSEISGGNFRGKMFYCTTHGGNFFNYMEGVKVNGGTVEPSANFSCGRFSSGTFKGTWHNGTWEGGTWEGKTGSSEYGKNLHPLELKKAEDKERLEREKARLERYEADTDNYDIMGFNAFGGDEAAEGWTPPTKQERKNFPNLIKFISFSFGGSEDSKFVSFSEFTHGLSLEAKQALEEFLVQNPKYIHGLPYREQSKSFDVLLATNSAARLLSQRMYANE